MEYLVPSDVPEAVGLLASGEWTILAGGTDYYPARVGGPNTDSVIDITGLAELRSITETDGFYRIGALTTWSDIVGSDLPRCFDGLRMAARSIGGVQVQNVATVVGNLCNASPAADGVPPLLCLDASLELRSQRGTRTLELTHFISGNRKTALRNDEIVTAVLVPTHLADAATDFRKLGSRRYLVISIAMVAALVSYDPAGRVALARIAIGACSPVALRAERLEADLIGRPGTDDLSAVVTRAHMEMLEPIDDVRAPASYRLEAAMVLTQRALRACGASA